MFRANDQIKALLCLNELQISLKRRHRLLELCDGDFSRLYAVADDNGFALSAEKIMGSRNLAELREMLANDAGTGLAKELDAKGIIPVAFNDEVYSEALKEICDFPLLLYCRGNVGLLKERAISVVGTRRPSRYGLNVCDRFVREFVRNGLTVVSGGARGIDAAAHRAALDEEGKTVVVLACGADVAYPAEHKGLFEKIADTGGLIISEYRPGTKPNGYQFPERNRIISGMAEALFIPEAALGSGSLITADLALEPGKDLFVTPCDINSEQGKGTNNLLKSMQGAMVLEPADVLEQMGIRSSDGNKTEGVQLDFDSQAVYDCLADGQAHIEEIIARTGIPVADLVPVLLDMELAGIIDRLSGNYYCLK